MQLKINSDKDERAKAKKASKVFEDAGLFNLSTLERLCTEITDSYSFSDGDFAWLYNYAKNNREVTPKITACFNELDNIYNKIKILESDTSPELVKEYCEDQTEKLKLNLVCARDWRDNNFSSEFVSNYRLGNKKLFLGIEDFFNWLYNGDYYWLGYPAKQFIKFAEVIKYNSKLVIDNSSNQTFINYDFEDLLANIIGGIKAQRDFVGAILSLQLSNQKKWDEEFVYLQEVVDKSEHFKEEMQEEIKAKAAEYRGSEEFKDNYLHRADGILGYNMSLYEWQEEYIKEYGAGLPVELLRVYSSHPSYSKMLA